MESKAKIASSLPRVETSSSPIWPAGTSAPLAISTIRASVDDVRELAQGLRGATDELRPEVAQLAQRLNRTADNLERASRGIEAFVAENRAGVTAFAQDGLPQLQRTLQEARDAAAEFAELSRSLKADPSQLIYQPVERGVKVKR